MASAPISRAVTVLTRRITPVAAWALLLTPVAAWALLLTPAAAMTAPTASISGPDTTGAATAAADITGAATAAPDSTGVATAAADSQFDGRRVALDLAEAVGGRFLDPQTAQRYAAMLRRNATAGHYDHFAARSALAARLTADMQAVAPDAHLRVLAGGPASAATPRPHAAPPHAPPPNGWAAPGVAYLRLVDMLCSPTGLVSISHFMADHSSASAFILDLRGNAGGTMAAMDAILPWFYRQPTRLMRLDSRATAGTGPLADTPSMQAMPAPDGVRRFDHWVRPRDMPTPLATADVYILTSATTASSAEHLTLAMQHSGRAVVIGERTSGAGHYGPIIGLADGFAAFIPVGRSYLADTGLGWEGVGITPDVPTTADTALAHALSLEKAVGGEALHHRAPAPHTSTLAALSTR